MLSCLKYSTHKGTNKLFSSRTTYTVLFIKDSILSPNFSIERKEDQNNETKLFLLSLMFHNHTRWRWYLPVVNSRICLSSLFSRFSISLAEIRLFVFERRNCAFSGDLLMVPTVSALTAFQCTTRFQVIIRNSLNCLCLLWYWIQGGSCDHYKMWKEWDYRIRFSKIR